jgi:hypothetical protein
VSTLDAARGEIGHWYPSALPDGRHALITTWMKASGLNDADVALLDLETGTHRVLFKGSEARYVDPGFLIYLRAGVYYAVRFDPQTAAVSGDPVRVLDDAFGNSPQGDVINTDLSVTGTLAYLSGPHALPRELAWVSASGALDALPFPARGYAGVDVAPDRRRLAVGSLEAGRYLIRLIDLDRRTDDALDLPGSNWDPVWHPDGRRLAFLSMRKGDFDVYWTDLTASNPPEPLLVTEFDDTPHSFLPDASALVVRQSDAEGRYLHKVLPLQPPGPPSLLVPFAAGEGVVSPDGKFLAFVSARSGTDEIYVQPMTGGAPAERVSRTGGTVAAWSRDGRQLFYLRSPEIVAMTFAVDAGRFRPLAERVWSRVEGNYDTTVLEVGTDGRLLVAIDRKNTVRQIRVIVNWQQEIAAKVR